MAAARAELCDVTLQFLEASLHALLYARRLYPAALFEQRAVFGCVAWLARAPDVAAAVAELLASLRPLLLAGVAEGLTFVVLDAPGGAPLEAVAFALSLDGGGARASYADVDASLGAALARLQALEAERPPLPPGATWTALLHTHEPPGAGEAPAALAAATPSPWARVDAADAALGALAAPPSARAPRAARPIKSVRAGALTIDVELLACSAGGAL
jgi:hypothetical protein